MIGIRSPAWTEGVGWVDGLLLCHEKTERHVYGFADADAGGG
jgi:hypothetical protein